MKYLKLIYYTFLTFLGFFILMFSYNYYIVNNYSDYQMTKDKKLIQSVENNLKERSEIMFEEINSDQNKILFLNKNREDLYKKIKPFYFKMNRFGIIQLQFHTKNSTSFLRFHNYKLYGDNLSKTRKTVLYVENKFKPVFSYERGNYLNGYRAVYPLFYNEDFIGSVEFVFSLNELKRIFQKDFNKGLSFLIKKNNNLKENDNKQEIFNFYYYQNKNDFFHSLKDKINKDIFLENKNNLLREKNFYTFKHIDNKIYFISFISLKDFENKFKGYTIIYSESFFLERLHSLILYQLFLMFLISFILSFYLLKIKESHKKIKFLATHDNLTGVGNRNYLDLKIKEYRLKDFSIIMIDIDFFKVINDTYGHKVGDLALKRFVELIKPHLNKYDIFIRYGGEEFIIILNSDKEKAIKIAEKIRLIIETESQNKEIPAFTCSLGVSHTLETAHSKKQAFILADKRLYKAKETGRNKVIFN